MLQPKSFFPQGKNSHGNMSWGFFITFFVLPFLIIYFILKSIFGKSRWGKKYERIYPKGYVKDKKRYKQIEKRLYGNRI